MMFIVIQNPASGETLARNGSGSARDPDEFAEREVSEDDLQKFKAQYEAGRVFGLQSVSGKVSTLAAFQTYTGSPAGIGDEIQRYLNVEVLTSIASLSEYIAGKPAVILSIVPKGKPELAAADKTMMHPNGIFPKALVTRAPNWPCAR